MPIHTVSNPFVPRSSVIRFPNGIFELRLHVHGVPSQIQLVAHDNYILVTGRIVPRARIDAQGRVSTLLWSDYPCGYFGRDIPLNLNPATEVVVIERRQEAEDVIIRYTLRPKATAAYNCASFARVDQFSSRPYAQPVYNDAFAASHYPSHGKGAACACGPQQATQVPYALSSGAPVAYGPVGYDAPVNNVAFPQAYATETAGVHAGFSAHLGNVDVNANIGEGVTLKEGVATVI